MSFVGGLKVRIQDSNFNIQIVEDSEGGEYYQVVPEVGRELVPGHGEPLVLVPGPSQPEITIITISFTPVLTSIQTFYITQIEFLSQLLELIFPNMFA